RAAATAGLLLQIVGNVHLGCPTLVLRLGGTVAALFHSGRHRSISPFLIVIRRGAQVGGAAVDLFGGLAEFLRADFSQRRSTPAELLLPGRGMRERQEVAGP